MRIYDAGDEEGLYLFRRAAAWRRSGLASEAQFTALAAFAPALRRTTLFLRILLFVFTAIGLAASVGLVDWLFHLHGTAARVWWGIAAALAYGAAEHLAGEHRFHRHGAEEALAAGALTLILIVVVDILREDAWGWLAFSVGAFYLYARFGFLYAALAGFLGCAGLSFSLFDGALAPRAFLGILLLTGFIASLRGDRPGVPAFLREERGILAGALLLGLCLAANLGLAHMPGLGSSPGQAIHAGVAPEAYWTSYALTFLIPLAGLALGLKTRRRVVIAASAVGLIVGLCTNKTYLGLPRYAWDPAVLGLVLIATAAVLERWLGRGAGGERNGYTARDLLKPASHGLEAAALGAGLAGFGAGSGAREDPSWGGTGGGRSGGGGAQGDF